MPPVPEDDREKVKNRNKLQVLTVLFIRKGGGILKKYIIPTTIILGILLLWGCSAREYTTTVTTGNPTAQEILKMNSEADIFQWGGTIYQTNIDWVDELILTEGDLVGTIEYNSSNPIDFKNATANILPIGTEIYQAKERNDVLIAKYGDELKYYYQLVEG